ncbi:uncharacterized protein B4U80_09702 [Leptotrombidium deliense]|uniref:ATP-dependent DNA helicase n=1 Tax=Leptotrombidium deliense TaxID=299467 RepID=A0A443RT42_9ACAR|nr:uncharacterized protein B4U80_09702 [Leptotrombidium deliense]
MLLKIGQPGGCGKIFLYHILIHNAIYQKKKIFTIAWTGIAAILLPFGKTAHKSFQLPFSLEEKSTLYWIFLYGTMRQ